MEYIAEKEIKDYQFWAQGIASPSAKEGLKEEQNHMKKTGIGSQSKELSLVEAVGYSGDWQQATEIRVQISGETKDVDLEPRDAKDEVPEVDGEIIKEKKIQEDKEKKKGMKKIFGCCLRAKEDA